MNIKYFVVIALIGALILVVSVLSRDKQEQQTPPLQNQAIVEPVRLVASFEIYTNGTKRDFSNVMYHNLNKEMFIEGVPPYNIIVNASNVTWQQFFDTLPAPFKITSDCLITGTGQTFCNSDSGKLSFLLNNQSDANAFQKPIRNNDNLVIKFE